MQRNLRDKITITKHRCSSWTPVMHSCFTKPEIVALPRMPVTTHRQFPTRPICQDPDDAPFLNTNLRTSVTKRCNQSSENHVSNYLGWVRRAGSFSAMKARSRQVLWTQSLGLVAKTHAWPCISPVDKDTKPRRASFSDEWMPSRSSPSSTYMS